MRANIQILRPSPEEGHDARAPEHGDARVCELLVARVVHLLVEQELVREEFDEPRVDEDTRGERVHDARDDRRFRRVRVVGRADAEPGGNPDWRGDAVEQRADDGDVVVACGQPEEGETGSETESLEHFWVVEVKLLLFF